MKQSLLLVCITLFAMIGRTEEINAACDFSVPKIDRSAFTSFFQKLKAAATAKDVQTIDALVTYPLKINSDTRSKTIKDRRALEKEFSTVFTPKILQLISQQSFEDLFCRDEGIMIGDGEVWIKKVKHNPSQMGIAVINL